AEGFVQLATVPDVDGELFNLGCGTDVSMREVATTILDLMGNPIEAEFGAYPDRPTEIWEMRCDPTKARERFGYETRTSLQEGLARTIAWYRHELESGDSPFAA